MATSLGDTYLGLAHTAPAISPQQLRWLNARWAEWEPFMVMESRRTSTDPAATLFHFRTRHRERVIRLLTARVAWRAIKQSRLDDPLLGDNLFEFSLRAAMERRRSRMGRQKGQRRRHV